MVKESRNTIQNEGMLVLGSREKGGNRFAVNLVFSAMIAD